MSRDSRHRDQDPAALLRQHLPSRHRAALAGHAWNLAENIQAPAADAIAVEHAQAPGCDQLRTIWPASPAAERRGAMTRTPTAAFVQGRDGRGRPGASGPVGWARRPGHDYPPARAGGSPAARRMKIGRAHV